MRHLDVSAHVDVFHIHVNPGVGHGAFALDAHRSADHFHFRQLAERHLRAGWRGHDDFAQRFEVLTEVAVVTEIHRVTLQAFDRRRERHSAERDFENVLDRANRQPVAGNLVAVDVEFDVVAAHHALGEDARRAGHLPHHHFNLRRDALQLREVRARDLDAHRSLDAGRQHVDARLDRHRPGVVQSGDLDGGVERVHEFIRRAAAMRDDFAVRVLDVHGRPFLFLLEHDGCLHHVEGRGVGRRFGAANLAEDVMHFGERPDDFVGLLKNLAGLRRRDAGECGRHVEQVAFIERRHELGAEVPD